MNVPKNWRRNVHLAEFTSMKLGGLAEFFCEVRTRAELVACYDEAQKLSLPIHLLGGGSNLVISDQGLTGLTVLNLLNENKIRYEPDTKQNRTSVTVDAGENWDQFVDSTCKRGLYGVECMSGIPGTVGAAPVQNIGAYGQELADTLQAVELMSVATKNIFWVDPSFLQLRYRSSTLKLSHTPTPYVITAIRLSLLTKQTELPAYPELNARLKSSMQGRKQPLSSKEIREHVLAIRRQKSMVLDQRDPWSQSCGSFFTNPILSTDDGERLQNLAKQNGWPEIPMYLTSDFKFKVSAARLIELSGLQKGFAIGTACISEKHALAIVNRGDSAQDVHRLCLHVQSRVLEKFGVTLEPEPQFWGPF